MVRAHVEGAGVLHGRLDRARWHPAYDRRQHARLRARRDAHLAGLAVAGREAIEPACDLLRAFGGHEELFVCATLALALDDDALLDVVEAHAASTPAVARAATCALLTAAPASAARVAQRWQRGGVAVLRRAALSADLVRRGSGAAPHAAYAARDDDALVRARAWRALAELGQAAASRARVPLPSPADAASDDEWAALTAALAMTSRRSECVESSSALHRVPADERPRLLVLTATLLQADALLALAASLARDPVLAPYAPLLLASGGHAAHLAVLLDWLESSRVGPAAGYAIAHLLGIDAAAASLLSAATRIRDDGEDAFGPWDELPPWDVERTRRFVATHPVANAPRGRWLRGVAWTSAAALDTVPDPLASRFAMQQHRYLVALQHRRPVQPLP
ncbi:MAG: hypothetical protein MUE41_06730 [Gemmatimonadaceae bacterium]|jgi:hypothetical protein|nr:hypothetical protein [Gemmatimonadaceae bacterium]